MIKKYSLTILSIIIIVTIAIYVKLNFYIMINHSESLPIKAVIIKRGLLPTKVDQIFAFKVRNNPHYQLEEINFIKKLGGKKGDRVEIRNTNTVYINEKYIGKAKERSLKGIELFMIEPGVIPVRKYFGYTPHKDSYDSKYKSIGLIDEKDIIGTAIIVF